MADTLNDKLIIFRIHFIYPDPPNNFLKFFTLLTAKACNIGLNTYPYLVLFRRIFSLVGYVEDLNYTSWKCWVLFKIVVKATLVVMFSLHRVMLATKIGYSNDK